jgi:hypothetical protein
MKSTDMEAAAKELAEYERWSKAAKVAPEKWAIRGLIVDSVDLPITDILREAIARALRDQARVHLRRLAELGVEVEGAETPQRDIRDRMNDTHRYCGACLRCVSLSDHAHCDNPTCPIIAVAAGTTPATGELTDLSVHEARERTTAARWPALSGEAMLRAGHAVTATEPPVPVEALEAALRAFQRNVTITTGGVGDQIRTRPGEDLRFVLTLALAAYEVERRKIADECSEAAPTPRIIDIPEQYDGVPLAFIRDLAEHLRAHRLDPATLRMQVLLGPPSAKQGPKECCAHFVRVVADRAMTPGS